MIKEFVARNVDRLSPFLTNSRGVRGAAKRPKYQTVHATVDAHFSDHVTHNHPSRKTLSLALEMLAGKPANIVETGSSAWGTNSSLLFDSYVNSFGGQFSTVDIRIMPTISLRSRCTNKTSLYCDDSVSFLKSYRDVASPPDLVYLDSWDVDWDAPLASAIHGLHEFLSILPAMPSGSLLLIDDTPKDADVLSKVNVHAVKNFEKFLHEYGLPPGKGALVKNYLTSRGIGKEVAHDYQLMWQL